MFKLFTERIKYHLMKKINHFPGSQQAYIRSRLDEAIEQAFKEMCNEIARQAVKPVPVTQDAEQKGG